MGMFDWGRVLIPAALLSYNILNSNIIYPYVFFPLSIYDHKMVWGHFFQVTILSMVPWLFWNKKHGYHGNGLWNPGVLCCFMANNPILVFRLSLPFLPFTLPYHLKCLHNFKLCMCACQKPAIFLQYFSFHRYGMNRAITSSISIRGNISSPVHLCDCSLRWS